MKHKSIIDEYSISIQIIVDVIAGKSLNDAFNNSIINDESINISKIKDITSGVIRYYKSLVILLNRLVSKTITDKKIETTILIGLYEINHTNKPHYAIVDYLVNLSYKLTKNSKIKNFVNAVLRNYLRKKDQLHNILADNIEFKYSIDKWWIDKLSKDYPDSYEKILKANNYIPKICLRVNNKKISLTEYKKFLDLNEIPYTVIDDRLVLEKNIKINNLPYFAEGFVSVQNISAQKLLEIIDIGRNAKILDACCAPGGKMCQILENFSVDITGIDIEKNRLDKAQQNLDRLSLNAILIEGDASKLDWWDKKHFNIVIADVPCSASGTIKKNPDIKLHRKLNDIKKLVKQQREIVVNLLNVLKVGDKMLYITCSIFSDENEKNMRYLTENYKNIKIIKELHILPDEYYDGFYYCLLEKI